MGIKIYKWEIKEKLEGREMIKIINYEKGLSCLDMYVLNLRSLRFN